MDTTTEPTHPTGEPLSLDQMVYLARERSGPELQAMARRVERVGGCERPIRLRAVGAVSPTADEPDGVLLVACKTRRESRCRPCASTYRGDARQLVRAGIDGGKGVPESVRRHAAVFVTLSAPSFGAVHRAHEGPCHLGPPGRCRHGGARHCLARHEEGEEIVGSPLCPGCYDYEAAVVFNATVGELWRRLVIYARRYVAYALGLGAAEGAESLRLSYVKVAELQRRGVVHLHAVVRADSTADELAPAPVVTRELLAGAVAVAARAVFATRTVAGRTHRLVFGGQMKIDPIEQTSTQSVASYLAKYTTKEASGSAVLDHRLREGELEELELPEHLRSVVATCWSLGAEDGQGRYRRSAHALGFTGHVLTKSRRYSTTFERLRAERRAWRAAEAGEPASAPSTVPVVWCFAGVGYRRAIDRLLARSFAEHRQETRRAAMFELYSCDAPVDETRAGVP